MPVFESKHPLVKHKVSLLRKVRAIENNDASLSAKFKARFRLARPFEVLRAELYHSKACMLR